MYIFNVVRQDQVSLVGVALGLPAAIGLVGAVDLWNVARIRTLEKRYPGAFVAQLVPYPQLFPQLEPLVRAGVGRGRVGSSGYASIVVDRSSVRIFAGAWRPRESFSITGMEISDLRVRRVPQGKWILSSLELQFGSGDEAILVDLCLMRLWLGIPVVLRAEALAAKLTELREVLFGAARASS
jgi:hypothetical protein